MQFLSGVDVPSEYSIQRLSSSLFLSLSFLGYFSSSIRCSSWYFVEWFQPASAAKAAWLLRGDEGDDRDLQSTYNYTRPCIVLSSIARSHYICICCLALGDALLTQPISKRQLHSNNSRYRSQQQQHWESRCGNCFVCFFTLTTAENRWKSHLLISFFPPFALIINVESISAASTTHACGSVIELGIRLWWRQTGQEGKTPEFNCLKIFFPPSLSLLSFFSRV